MLLLYGGGTGAEKKQGTAVHGSETRQNGTRGPSDLDNTGSSMIVQLLRERQGEIAQRWTRALLATYPADAAALFEREQDPFANPVGRTIREGTAELLQAILNGMDPHALRRSLDLMLRVRAVQQFSPSQAVGFVFALKPILRAVIPEARSDTELAEALSELDDKVDQVALLAFDVYSECREEISRLRVAEVKRQVAWVMEQLQKRSRRAGLEPGGRAGEDLRREELPGPGGEAP